jgi:hypothetical protein
MEREKEREERREREYMCVCVSARAKRERERERNQKKGRRRERALHVLPPVSFPPSSPFHKYLRSLANRTAGVDLFYAHVCKKAVARRSLISMHLSSSFPALLLSSSRRPSTRRTSERMGHGSLAKRCL